MIKSILLFMRPHDVTRVGANFALEFAKAVGARIEALCVVDPDVISPPEPVPIGGDAYKTHKDEALVAMAEHEGQSSLDKFVAACVSSGISGEGVLRTGETIELLSSRASCHDAIILGFEAGSSEDREREIEVASELIESNPRPLIIATRSVQAGATLIAYDGSIPAMRSLQLFSALGLRRDGETFVLTVGKNADECSKIADAGASYMNERGYKAQPLTVTTSEAPSTIILDEARKRGAGMIVAGAYGHRGWNSLLFGTTTEELLTDLNGVLFIHH